MVFAAGRGYGKSAALRSWMTVNEFRRLHLNEDWAMDYSNNWFTNAATTSTSSTITVGTTTNYPVYYNPPVYKVSYGDAVWPQPLDTEVKKAPKRESDMAWLKRRIAEVSWVPA